MTCVTNYNLIQEGDVYNDTSVTTYDVTTSGLRALYDDDYATAAYTISVSGVSSLIVRFGEYFDVCNVKYYASPIVMADISMSYGLESAYETDLSPVSSGTYVFADVSSPVGYLNITHSGSSDVDVQQLFVEGVENYNIGFGTSSASGITDQHVPNSPVAHYSSTPLEIPVYNEYPYVTDIKVAVAPTGNEADDFIYLSTSASGTFYGINDYGVTQPAHIRITTSGESLDLGSVEYMYENWDFSQGSETYLYVGDDYLQWNMVTDNVKLYRQFCTWNCYHNAFFVDKREFTADQSFTISIDVRYIDATLDNLDGLGRHGNKFMLGFTNSYPIIQYGPKTTYSNSPTYDRQGRSMAFVWIGGMDNYGEYDDLYVGSGTSDYDFYSYTAYTNFNGIRLEGIAAHPIIAPISLEYLSANVFGESAYYDGTSAAPWRTLKMSYDHIKRTAYFFFDGVSLGEYKFTSGALAEACKFFFGYNGYGASVVDVKNFQVEVDKVYTVHTSQANANAYASKDVTNHGPEKLVDGLYGERFYPHCWVSDDNPTAGDYFSLEFPEPYTIDAVRVRYSGRYDTITVSGITTNPTKYTLGLTYFTFDTGDVRVVDFATYESDGLDGWAVGYLATTSGTIESVEGATLVSGVISTVNTREGSPRSDLMAIDEIEFYTISGTINAKDWEEEDDSFCWRRGYTRNLMLDGSDNMFRIKYDDWYDVCLREYTHELMYGAEYYFTNPAFDTGSTTVRHYGEALFALGDRESSEISMFSGRDATVWRFFEERITLKAVYFEFFSNPLTGPSFNGKIDKWKLQYLRDGGNPYVEDDWKDIPPITQPYHTAGSYRTYTEYLIANNDGEYYTDYINSLDAVGAYTVPTDLYCRKNRFWPVYSVSSFSGVTTAINVEFDEGYRTQAVRVVIADGYSDTSRTTPAVGYSIMLFTCYGEHSTGSYVSPIFDTHTKQNTERIFVDTDAYGGSVTTLYRSSDTPPTQKFDSAYEMWEDAGNTFGGLGEAWDFQPFYGGHSMTAHGDKMYFLGKNTSRMMSYDIYTRKWEWSESFPTEAGGQKVLPDTRTRNNTVVVGDSIICASVSDDGTTLNSSLMRYYLEPNEYNFSGWDAYPYQRQPEATYAGMASDGDNRIFFLSRDGDITVFYLDTGDLNTEGRQPMPLHGSSNRDYIVPVYVDGKIYVAGGYGAEYWFDIYDVNNDTWESSVLPHWMRASWLIHYDGFVYALPWSVGGSPYDAIMKYEIESETWTVIPSLGWNYPTSNLEIGSPEISNAPVPDTYCLVGDYVYAHEATRGDFRRFKLKKETWESGYLAGKDDSRWRNIAGMTWKEVTTSGELMPQDRYIQYKVEMETEEGVISPMLKGSTVVLPQTIQDVSISGTENFYLKTGVSVDMDVECWYTGYDWEWLPTIMYGRSASGDSLYHTTPAVRVATTSGISFEDYGYFDSFVQRDGSDYTMWATHAKKVKFETFPFVWGNIHRSTSTDGYTWDTFQHVLGRNTEGTYDTYNIFSPTVVEDGGFEMWYTGVDNSNVNRIMHASSSDGITWGSVSLSHDKGTVSLEPDADISGALNPSVIKSDGVYYMWYEGLDASGASSIIYCQSIDGMSWSGHEIVLTAADIDDPFVVGCGSPCVVEDMDIFRMWFTVYYRFNREIYYSYSIGGLVWSVPQHVASRKQEKDTAPGLYNVCVDLEGIGTSCALVNREVEPPNVFHNAKVKIYND